MPPFVRAAALLAILVLTVPGIAAPPLEPMLEENALRSLRRPASGEAQPIDDPSERAAPRDERPRDPQLPPTAAALAATGARDGELVTAPSAGVPLADGPAAPAASGVVSAPGPRFSPPARTTQPVAPLAIPAPGEMSPTVHTACHDLADNDGDLLIDLVDPGCTSLSDVSEEEACQDGLDNDGDGLVDGSDPGCANGTDNDETNAAPATECSDGLDNDGDLLADYPLDPQCADASDDDEGGAACSDGVDNDGDGNADFPLDFGCSLPSDDDETNGQCFDGVDNDADTKVDFGQDPGCLTPEDNDETDPVALPSIPRFLVLTRVGGSSVKCTDGLMGIPAPIDVNGDLLPDISVGVVPDLALARATIGIERLPSGDGVVGVNATVLVPLTGLDTCAASDDQSGDWLYVGYDALAATPPAQFNVTAGALGLGEADQTTVLALRIEQAAGPLALLGGTFTSTTWDTARLAGLAAAVTLGGIAGGAFPIEGCTLSATALPSDFTASARIRTIETAGPAITVLDWRAGATPTLDATVASYSDAAAETMRAAASAFPSRVSFLLRSDDPVVASYDASSPIPRFCLGSDVRKGLVTESVRAILDDVPRHASLSLDPAGKLITYVGDAPLGPLDFFSTNYAPVQRLPGYHLLAYAQDGDESVSVRLTGLRSIRYETAGGMELDVHFAAPQPFAVEILDPESHTVLAIDALPTDVELSTDFAGRLRYRASAPIASIVGCVEKAVGDCAAGAIDSFAFTFEGVPTSIDADFDGGAGKALIVLDAPLAMADLTIVNGTHFNGTLYDHLRIHLESVPGLAASWRDNGSEVHIATVPPTATFGRVDVELADGPAYATLPGFDAYVVNLNTTLARQASIRIRDFHAFDMSRDNATGELDLRFVTKDPHTFGLEAENATARTTLAVDSLPRELRVLTDMNRSYSYTATDAIAEIVARAENKTSGVVVDLLVEDLPPRFLALVDNDGGAAVFETDPASEIGRVRLHATHPDTWGNSSFRTISVDAYGIPALRASWADSSASFTTDGGAIDRVRAHLTSQLVPTPFLPLPPQASDWVKMENGTFGTGSSRIDVHVTGLIEGAISRSETHLIAEIGLAAARVVEATYQSRHGFCLEADVAAVIAPLPARVRIETDLVSTFRYTASEPIPSLDVTVAAQKLTKVGCSTFEKTELHIDDLPATLEVSFSSDPVAATYRASAPIRTIDVNRFNATGPTRRMIAHVEGLPTGLFAQLNVANSTGLLKATCEEKTCDGREGDVDAIGLVELTVSTKAFPDDMPSSPPHYVRLLREITPSGKQDNTTWLRVTGLRSFSFASADSDMAIEAEIAEERLEASVTDARANLEAEFAIEKIPSRLRFASDMASYYRLDGTTKIQTVDARICIEGTLGACTGDLITVALAGLTKILDVRMVGRGVYVDIGGASFGIDYIAIDLVNPDGLFGDTADTAVKYVKLRASGVGEGHVLFADPHAIDVDFLHPIGVEVYITNDPERQIPREQVSTSGAQNEVLAYTLIDEYDGIYASIFHVRLGPTPSPAGIACCSEGVRGVKLDLDSDLKSITASLELPDLLVATWRDGHTLPAFFLHIDAPPSFLSLTMSVGTVSYPVAAWGAHSWAYPEDTPGFYPLNRFDSGVAANPDATTSRITYLATEDSGAVKLLVDLKGGTYFATETQDFISLSLSKLPDLFQATFVSDGRVSDVGSDPGPKTGGYSAVDIEFSSPVIVDGWFDMDSERVRLDDDFWYDDGDTVVSDGAISRFFFDNFASFDLEYNMVPNGWMHFAAHGSIWVGMGLGTYSRMGSPCGTCEPPPFATTEWDPSSERIDHQESSGNDWLATTRMLFDGDWASIWFALGNESGQDPEACYAGTARTIARVRDRDPFGDTTFWTLWDFENGDAPDCDWPEFIAVAYIVITIVALLTVLVSPVFAVPAIPS